MERAAGGLPNAVSGRVRRSKAPRDPPDWCARCRGLRSESRTPRGDRAAAPRQAPELPPFPGGAFLPSTSRPEQRRALGVRPEPASSALAAPGQLRCSARWMCVAGAKLKVSGLWARSSVSVGDTRRLRRARGALRSGGPSASLGARYCSRLEGVREGKLGRTFLTWRTGDCDLQYF